MRNPEELNKEIESLLTAKSSLEAQITEKRIFLENLEFSNTQSNLNFYPTVNQEEISELKAQIPPEYVDHISSMQNSISEYESTFAISMDILSSLHSDVENLQAKSFMSSFSIGSSDFRLSTVQTQNSLSIKQIKEARESLYILQSIIKIKNYDIKVLEDSLSELAKRVEGYELHPGGLVDLHNSISNLKTEIEASKGRLQRGLADLNESIARTESDANEFEQKMGKVRAIYNWHEVRESIGKQEDLSADTFQRNSKKLEEMKDELAERRKRLRTLKKLNDKFSKNCFDNESIPIEKVDDLLRKIDFLNESNGAFADQQREKLKALKSCSAALEKEIRERSGLLVRTLMAVRGELEGKASATKERREKNSESERALLDQLFELQKKALNIE